MAETYNEDEVKELFDVVFKLSAKDVDDKLKKVSNRPEIAKRRWFWELLQNAKDAVKPTEKVSVRLDIEKEDGQPFVNFLHNGNPFKYQDAQWCFARALLLQQNVFCNGAVTSWFKVLSSFNFFVSLDRSNGLTENFSSIHLSNTK